MGMLSGLRAFLQQRNAFDVTPPADVGTGDVLVVQDFEVRVVPYGTPSDGDVLTVDSSSPTGWSVQPPSGGGGGGGGDNVSVGVTAATDAKFSDTTPAAPTSGILDDLLVKWQIDTTTAPDSISAYVPMDALAALLPFVLLEVNGTPVTAADLNDTTPAAPAAGVKVRWQLSGGNVSAYVASTDVLTEIGDRIDARFGDGSDGAHTLTGNETLTEDKHYTDLNLAGFDLQTNGFVVWGTGTLTYGGGRIKNLGVVGTIFGGGNGTVTGTGPLGPGGNGSAGGNNANGGAVAGITNNWAQHRTKNDTTTGKGAVGGISGTGRLGGTVAAFTSVPANAGRATDLLDHGVLISRIGTTVLNGNQGGSGGGADGNFGAGGGSSGGNIVVAFRHHDTTGGGTITAQGGAGGTPSAANGGGGGGGAGGNIRLIYETASPGLPTLDVSGGAGGAKTGTGVVGGTGATGFAETIRVRT